MNKKHKNFWIYKLQDGGSLVLAALWLSLKANEAERPQPHPHPRSWLKQQPAPPLPQSWLIWTCVPWLLTSRMAWEHPLSGGQSQRLRERAHLHPEASPTPSLLNRAKLKGHSVTDCPHAVPACRGMCSSHGRALATFSYYEHSDGAAHGTVPVQTSLSLACTPEHQTGHQPLNHRFLAWGPAVSDLGW